VTTGKDNTCLANMTNHNGRVQQDLQTRDQDQEKDTYLKPGKGRNRSLLRKTSAHEMRGSAPCPSHAWAFDIPSEV